MATDDNKAAPITIEPRPVMVTFSNDAPTVIVRNESSPANCVARETQALLNKQAALNKDGKDKDDKDYPLEETLKAAKTLLMHAENMKGIVDANPLKSADNYYNFEIKNPGQVDRKTYENQQAMLASSPTFDTIRDNCGLPKNKPVVPTIKR